MKTITLRTRLKMLFITILALQFLMVDGQTGDSVLTLRDCIRLSLKNSIKLKQSQLEKEKSLYQYKEARSAGLPQVNGNASAENYFNIPVSMVSGDIFGQPGTMLPIQLGTKYNANGGIQAGQMIYNASYFASLSLFRKSCEIKDLNFQKGKEELAFNVAQLYVFLQMANLQLELLDSNLTVFQKIYEYSEQHFKNGFIRKTDLDRVTVAINNIEAEKENLISVRNQQLNMLRYLIGFENARPVAISENIQIPDVAVTLKDSTFSSNTDIMILGQQIELAKLNLKLTCSEYLPSLTGYAVYNYQAQREQLNFLDKKEAWYKVSYVGVRINIPVFEGGRIKNKEHQNRIELEQAMNGQLDLKKEMYVNYLSTLQKLNTSKAIALKLDENMALAETVFRITNEQYRQGLKSLTDVLNAQSEFNISRLTWLQTSLQIRFSELEIAKINGGIRLFFL